MYYNIIFLLLQTYIVIIFYMIYLQLSARSSIIAQIWIVVVIESVTDAYILILVINVMTLMSLEKECIDFCFTTLNNDNNYIFTYRHQRTVNAAY